MIIELDDAFLKDTDRVFISKDNWTDLSVTEVACCNTNVASYIKQLEDDVDRWKSNYELMREAYLNKVYVTTARK